MNGMFSSCSGLTSLDVSNFNTENVVGMENMFQYCSRLTGLDLSGFNTANVTNMKGMLSYCSNLTTVYAGEGWSTEAVTDSYGMFSNCLKLKGGKGTVFDTDHVDAEYARLDGGPSNPGYFSAILDYERGDVSGNGLVNISDVTELINYLLTQDASGINLDAADCNQNGSVTISDVTALINFLLSHTW